MKIFFLSLLISVGLLAQSGPGVVPNLPSSWVGAGGAYTTGGHPPVAGWATFAQLISQSSQIYSYSTYQTVVVNKLIQTSMQTGFATVIRQFGNFYCLGYGQIGLAQTPQALTSAFSGGGMGMLRIGKTNWTIELGAEALNGVTSTQTIFKLGIGRF